MQLAHIVYFTLKEQTPAQREKLVAACHKYLKDHPGVVYFSAGTRVPDLARPVNDQTFDVGLHVVFDSRAAHDAYQTAPTHLQFIAEWKEHWAVARVFDSNV